MRTFNGILKCHVRLGKSLSYHMVQPLSDACILVMRSMVCDHLGTVKITAVMGNSLLLYLKSSELSHL